MFREKGLRKIAQVAQVAIGGVRPIVGKSVAVVALFTAPGFITGTIADVFIARGVGIIARVGTVGNHKNLHKVK